MNEKQLHAIVTIACELIRAKPEIILGMAENSTARSQFEQGINNLVKQVAKAVLEVHKGLESPVPVARPEAPVESGLPERYKNDKFTP